MPGVYNIKKEEAGPLAAEIESEDGFVLVQRRNLRFMPDELVRQIDYHLLNPYFPRISESFPEDP